MYQIDAGSPACTPIDEICDTFGVSRQAIAKLRDAGTVVRIAEGQYDLAASAKNYIASLRERSQTPDLTAARVRLTESKAAMAEMARLREVGALIPADEVERAWSQKISIFRTRLLAIPTKVAARVRMASTISEVAKLIREEINAVLTELSRGSAASDGEAA